MNETDQARVDQIRARVDAATDGPWYTTDDPPKALFPKAQRTPMRTLSSSRSVMSYPRKVPISLHWKADADFVAAARSDVPWLLDRLAAATERADKAEAAVRAVEMRHANLRCALSVLHAWPDGVTGKRMVDAEDILTLLEADRAALFPAEEAPSE